MVSKFNDYIDIETILSKAYRLICTKFGIDRLYPKKISEARAKFKNSEDAKFARAEKRKKEQMKYPARQMVLISILSL